MYHKYMTDDLKNNLSEGKRPKPECTFGGDVGSSEAQQGMCSMSSLRY